MKRKYYWVIPFVLIVGIGWKVMVDIGSLEQDSSPDSAADFVMSLDATDGKNKKVLMDDLPGGGLNNIVEDLTPQLGGDLDLNSKNLDFPTTVNISDVLDEDNMVSDSATKLATQQSIKAYTDSVAGVAAGWTDGAPNPYVTDNTDEASVGTQTARAKLHVRNEAAQDSFLVEDDTANPDLTPFVISPSGDVGVGTDTPTAKLDVVGTINASVGYTTTPSSGNTGHARLGEDLDNGTEYVGWKAPSSIASSIDWVLPNADAAGGFRSDGAGSVSLASASTTGAGDVEIATATETTTGTDTTRAVSPDGLAGSDFSKRVLALTIFESDAAVTVADGKVGIPITAELNGWNIVSVQANVYTKGVTGTTDIQIRRQRGAAEVDVLSVKVTLGDEYFASDGTVNTSNDDLATGDMLFIDRDAIHSGTAPNGLSGAITCQKP